MTTDEQNQINFTLAMECNEIKVYVTELEAVYQHYLRSDEIVIANYIYQAQLKLKSAIQTLEAGMKP